MTCFYKFLYPVLLCVLNYALGKIQTLKSFSTNIKRGIAFPPKILYFTHAGFLLLLITFSQQVCITFT